MEELDAPYFPADVAREGSRKVPFSRVIYIDRDDFMEEPPKDCHRLAPGREVRLRYAYVDPLRQRRQGPGDRRGDRAPLHLRSRHARRHGRGGAQGQGHHPVGLGRARARVEVRLYDRLFKAEQPNPRPKAATSKPS